MNDRVWSSNDYEKMKQLFNSPSHVVNLRILNPWNIGFDALFGIMNQAQTLE